MCIIVHKPASARIPQELVHAALSFNGDGWGLMGFARDGEPFVQRESASDPAALRAALGRHAQDELVLHLRLRTRGDASQANTHPFKVGPHLWLMHNGTLPMNLRIAGHSDTWHFVHDILRPLHQRYAGLTEDDTFVALLELGLKPENKLALCDTAARRVTIVNRAHGVEFEGLWLSNTRWIDRRLLPLADPPQPQQRSYAPDELQFV